MSMSQKLFLSALISPFIIKLFCKCTSCILKWISELEAWWREKHIMWHNIFGSYEKRSVIFAMTKTLSEMMGFVIKDCCKYFITFLYYNTVL